MTNLIISRVCNQSCCYCFASKETASQRPDFFPIESLEGCLDFLDRSGIQQARFLGGEPTLHPLFPEFVRRARERGKMIVVFTNGLMPRPALAALEALSPEQCSVVMNVNTMGNTGKNSSVSAQRLEVLRRLGQKVQPGCTIHRPDLDFYYIIDIIVETGCKRAVRLGLAQPILGGKNVFLPVRSYPWIGERIQQFAERAAREGIKVEFDCGFVRCMFTDVTFTRLEEFGADMGWWCSPIIDINTDGEIFHCFPLSGKYNTHQHLLTKEQMTATSLREMFENKTALYRQSGIYKECASCRYKHEQICSGGCLSNIINRFSTEPIHFSIQY